MPLPVLGDKNDRAGRPVSDRKLEAHRKNPLRSTGATIRHLDGARGVTTAAVDHENSFPFTETRTMAQTHVDTHNAEKAPAKDLTMPADDKGPPKFASENDEACLKAEGSSFQKTFGTTDIDLVRHLAEQAVTAVPNITRQDLRPCNPVLAALHGIGPRDTLEGLLAVQMVATHNLVMEFLTRAALKEQPTLGVDLNLNRATKLQRTFIAQMEALNRHRSKGEQKMNVEHVHVHDGAQAIVGPVNHQGSGNVSEEDHGKSNGKCNR